MSQNRLTNNSSKTDPFVKQFFARVPPQTAATFTDAQLTALKQVFKERISKSHAVDIKFSIPFPKQSFYVVFLLGKEKRLRPKNSSIPSVNRNTIITMSSLILITCLMSSLCVVKIASEENSLPNQEIEIMKSKR